MSAGVWLIWAGVDQVKPPSADTEKAMPSTANPLKRESCHTRYRLPLLGSTAISGMMSPPVRTGEPVSGSCTPVAARPDTRMGSDQGPVGLFHGDLVPDGLVPDPGVVNLAGRLP